MILTSRAVRTYSSLMQVWPALCVVAISVGCGEPDVPTEVCGVVEYTPRTAPHLLDELAHLRPWATVKMTSREDVPIVSLEVTATLWYGNTLIDGTPPVPGVDGDECPLLDDSFSATLDGLQGRVTQRGGWKCLVTGGPTCSQQTVTFDYPIGRPVTDPTLVIRDGSTTIAIPLDGAFGPRMASPIDPADWTLHANQGVRLAWTPESDLLRVGLVRITFTPTASGESFYAEGEVVGNALDFTVPDTTGDGLLEIEVPRLIDTSDYRVVLDMTFQQPVTITP
ncbi:MAG: hypothetical protein HOV81_31145 [Kofleriaceae bacterium]|nr:hypothetical protein [Kofleriaceae bacterium]